eukprot:scaffold132703_cov18-Prasinocladus_malaysianus.AAC.1
MSSARPPDGGQTSGKTNKTNPRNTMNSMPHDKKMLISAALSEEPAGEHSGQSTRQWPSPKLPSKQP